MEKKLIQEIKRIKELSNINEGSINENLLSDIKHFFEIASDKILETDTVKKLKEFFSEYIPDLDTETSETSLSFNETTTDDDFYKKILDGINAPHTPENMKFLYAWRQAEGGSAKNNPFNTTKKLEGDSLYGKNVAGVKNYQTVQDGIDATVKTLKNGYYDCIVNGLKNNIGALKISQSCDSSLKTWGTHGSTDLVTQVINQYERGSKPKPKPIEKGDFTK
jgi:hypothetical protein